MVSWMIKSLIHLSPDKDDLSEESLRIIYGTNDSIARIEEIAVNLFERIQEFTDTIVEYNSFI